MPDHPDPDERPAPRPPFPRYEDVVADLDPLNHTDPLAERDAAAAAAAAARPTPLAGAPAAMMFTGWRPDERPGSVPTAGDRFDALVDDEPVQVAPGVYRGHDGWCEDRGPDVLAEHATVEGGGSS